LSAAYAQSFLKDGCLGVGYDCIGNLVRLTAAELLIGFYVSVGPAGVDC
jgi:hypothetical protein